MSLDAATLADVIGDAIDRAIAPFLERVAVLEATIKNVDGLAREFAEAVRALSSTDPAVVELRERVAGLDAKVEALGALPENLAGVRERVATVEGRPPVPGPPGADGAPGKDGLDGLGFEDVSGFTTGDGVFTLRFAREDRVRDVAVCRPPTYCGVFRSGVEYHTNDLVTWDGSMWICGAVATTTKPGEGSPAWTLCVKRGRDGKDGAPGATGPAGPRGTDWAERVAEAKVSR